MLKAAILSFIAFLLCASACSRQQPVPPPEPKAWGRVVKSPSLAEHQKRWDEWNQKRPKHYRYVARLDCDCGPVTFNSNEAGTEAGIDAKVNRWLFIEVQDGNIVSVKNIDGTDHAGYSELTKGKELIEVGFEWMKGSIQRKPEAAYALYDSRFSFPRYLSFYSGIPDDGFQLEIVEFEVMQDDAK